MIQGYGFATCRSMDAVAMWTIVITCFVLPEAFHVHKRPAPYQTFLTHNSTNDVTTMQVILDLQLNHPYLSTWEQRVPGELLIFMLVFVPLGCHVAVTLLSKTRSVADATAFFQGWLTSLSVNHLLTSLLKRYVGRLRPYFYHECGFSSAQLACTNNNLDAHMSFPSGHSSSSFVAFGFTSIYLLGRLQLCNPNARGRFVQCFEGRAGRLDLGDVLLLAALTPMLIAVLVATSRIVDNDHHASDVAWGSAQGLLLAWLFYLRRFEPPFAANDRAGRARAEIVDQNEDVNIAA